MLYFLWKIILLIQIYNDIEYAQFFFRFSVGYNTEEVNNPDSECLGLAGLVYSLSVVFR